MTLIRRTVLLLVALSPVSWAQRGATPGATKVNEKDGLTYVRVASGTFTMGCSPGDDECEADEKPAHQVTITRGFWIGQTEVTQEAYQRVTGNNPSLFKGAQLPVEHITWTDAQEYCQAVGMRLPTEAEWEYAARGGNPASRYGSLETVAWYFANSDMKTHEVKHKQANAYGLFDMLGNVWEWTADWYDERYYQSTPRSDPPGASSGRLRAMRGGSWKLYPDLPRVSLHGMAVPVLRGFVGVRCAGE